MTFLTSIGGGGGSFSITSIEHNLGSTPAFSGKFTVIDAAVSSTSKIHVWQRFDALTNKGTRADENEMDLIDCNAVAGSGQFTVYWQTKTLTAVSKVVADGNTVRSSISALTPYQDASILKVSRIGKVKGNFKFNYIIS